MTGKVVVITGASQGIGAGLVAGYRERGWAVVATADTIKPSQDPEVVTTAQPRSRYPATRPAPTPWEAPVMTTTLPVMTPPAPGRSGVARAG